MKNFEQYFNIINESYTQPPLTVKAVDNLQKIQNVFTKNIYPNLEDFKQKQDITQNQYLIEMALIKYGITSNDAIANILGNLKKESGIKSKTESGNYRIKKLKELLKQKPNVYSYTYTDNDGKKFKGIDGVIKGYEDRGGYGSKDAEIWLLNTIYSNKITPSLGNGDFESGDGYKYRGRGFIQLSGKENYTKMSKFLGNVDLVGNPNLAMDPRYVFDIVPLYFLKLKGKTPESLQDLDTVYKTIAPASSNVKQYKDTIDYKERYKFAKAYLSVLKDPKIQQQKKDMITNLNIATLSDENINTAFSNNKQSADGTNVAVNYINVKDKNTGENIALDKPFFTKSFAGSFAPNALKKTTQDYKDTSHIKISGSKSEKEEDKEKDKNKEEDKNKEKNIKDYENIDISVLVKDIYNNRSKLHSA